MLRGPANHVKIISWSSKTSEFALQILPCDLFCWVHYPTIQIGIITGDWFSMHITCCAFSDDDDNTKPEALNKKALQIVKRVKDKLTGKYCTIHGHSMVKTFMSFNDIFLRSFIRIALTGFGPTWCQLTSVLFATAASSFNI